MNNIPGGAFSRFLKDSSSISYLFNLILSGGYTTIISDSGKIQAITVMYYGNSTCSGTPNIIEKSRIKEVFTANKITGVWENPSIGFHTDNSYPILYYFPENQETFIGPISTWQTTYNQQTRTYTPYCLQIDPNDANNLTTLLLNDPSVTNFDIIFYQSLQKPFRISIDY